MTERCHARTNGKRCKAKATTEASIGGTSTNPKPWSVIVCNRHAQWYVHGAYKVKQLEGSLK